MIRSREHSALSFLTIAQQMIDNGDIEAAIIQVKEALNGSSSLKVSKKVGRVMLKAAKFQITTKLALS